jgi:hypothetical protein
VLMPSFRNPFESQRREGNNPSFSPSPSNVDYYTVNYNELQRTMSNAVIGLKAFLTQHGYNTNFMSMITQEQLLGFSRSFCRRDKPSVERIISEEGLEAQLGIANADLDLTEERSVGVRTRSYADYLHSHHDFSMPRINEEQMDTWRELARQMAEPTRVELAGERPTDSSMRTVVGYSGSSRRVDVSDLLFHRESPQRRRSEQNMLMEIVRGENFPKPTFVNWNDNQELSEVIDDWYRNVEYKEQWIFSRREREGFNRRNIGQFSLDDVLARISKRRNPHPLDTSNSKIYDWKLGGTDWILRLELFTFDNDGLIEGLEDYDETMHFLVCRHIYKPTNTEVKYDVRYWNGEKFRRVTDLWTQWKDNERLIANRLSNARDEEEPFDPFAISDDDVYDDDDYEESPSW